LKNQLPELLAPAGTPDAAWAALAYGADAVYAGLPRFSARAEAGNFTAEALDELIGYVHHLGRRVYITLNTLVQQRELTGALETLALIRDLNADGVIVQDMGIVHLIRKNFPQIRLHASTQMAVHNLEGARQLAALGFKRVVLARELSLKAIEHISKNCGIETETFIHGALCYSYSGLCLFSSHLLGRSGNRGRCAYCCRQPFRRGGEETLPFSMKDFSAAEHLPELISVGVTSLKIEGRMKSPLYVAAVTDFYRKTLEGDTENSAQRLSDIQTIFGRPSTDLYLDDSANTPVDPINDGHRGALIGTVKAVSGPWLILHSNRALQKHDGLKVEMPGETSAYGFAADEMRLASDPESKRRFELSADAEIALRLPADHPRLAEGTPVYCSYSQAVRQRYDFSAPRPGQFRQRKPVNIHLNHTFEGVILSASANGVQSELILDGPFEAAKNPEKAAATIRQCFEKLGDTDWRLGELTLKGSVFVPVSVLNDARRRLIEQFSSIWKKVDEASSLGPAARSRFHHNFQTAEKNSAAPAACDVFWSVKSRRFPFDGAQGRQALENIDEFVLEIDPSRPEEIEKALAFYGDKLRLALPVIIRDEDAATFRKLIERFSNGSTGSPQGVWKWEAANVGGLNLLQGKQDVVADWPLYTLNAQAALQWREQGVQQFVLSPEDDAENLFALIEQLGAAAVVPVYQHTPLMISATHPAVNVKTPAEGSGPTDGCRPGDPTRRILELTDLSQRKFRVEQNGREFAVFNEAPFSLTNHLEELKARGARRFRIDLSYGIDSPIEAGAIVRQIISGAAVCGTDANFLRPLQ
jgi:putative protease